MVFLYQTKQNQGDYLKKACFDALCSCNIFSQTAPDTLRSLLSLDGITQKRFGKGEVIFSPCSFERLLGIVLRGEATVSKTKACSSDVPMSRLRPSDAFGMAAIFCERLEFPTQITALTDCEVLFFTDEALEKIFSRCPEVAKNYIVLLSEKIHFLNKKIDAFTSADAAERVLCWLRTQYENGEYQPQISMVRLAKLLDIGRTSLYRALDSLVEQGIITKDAKCLIINPEKINVQ